MNKNGASEEEVYNAEKKEKKKGVFAKKRSAHVDPLPYRPENKKLSKEEFRKARKRELSAQAAADEAYEAALGGSSDAESPELAEARARVDEIKAGLKKVKAALKKDSKNEKLKEELDKLTADLDEAEENLHSLEK